MCEGIELPPAEQLLTGELSIVHRELFCIPANRTPVIRHKSATLMHAIIANNEHFQHGKVFTVHTFSI
jgi:hypothetical protein